MKEIRVVRHTKNLSGLVAIAALLILGLPNQAEAQKFEQIQVIIKPQLNIDQSRRIRQIIRDIGGKRRASVVNGGKTSNIEVEPASYSIIPTADVGATEVAAGWNFWFDGSAGYVEDTEAVRAYDGSLISLSLGADSLINDKFLMGFILNHSATDITNNFVPGGSTTSAIGLGPYIGVYLTNTLVFTGSFLYTWTENNVDSGAVTAAYDSDSWGLNGSLTSYHQAGNWMLAPTVGVSYNDESDEAYIDSTSTVFGASTTRTGSLAFGGSVSYAYSSEGGLKIQPSLSVGGEWTFLRSVTATTDIPANTQDFDVNLTASTDFQFNPSVSLSLSSTVTGLTKPDYLSVTGGGRLSISF